jgi:hypothetical protein
MSLAQFESLLSHPAPAFVCRSFEDARKFVVVVRHEAGPPASAELLAQIPELKDAEVARDVFARHNGALLFAAPSAFHAQMPDLPDAGMEIFPVETWREKTDEIVDQWAETAEEGFDDGLPYTRNDFVAIGHPRFSSNSFHWVTRGPAAGRIFWWPWTMPPSSKRDCYAKDFGQFLTKLCGATDRLVRELFFAGYTRYGDGRTAAQWNPERYVADARALRRDEGGYLIE